MNEDIDKGREDGGERDPSPESGADDFRFSPRLNRAHEIAWRPWGPQAFEEARGEGKLVLLSISAVWCHWCHVMDETTYSDQGIIDRINRDFIPVRVDSDRRPDVNRRYNQGGWPTTAFLVPTGRAVTGLTYAPPEQMSSLLEKLASLYRHRRESIEVEAAAAAYGEREALSGFQPGDSVDPETVANVEATIKESWDRGYGGIGAEPKFPPFDALEFALARFTETGDQQMRAFVVSTLDAMSLGEINDRVEGGFFRYAQSRDWGAPHYEKMLSDNAQLIRLYLWASTVFSSDDYAEVARRALEYLLATLADDEGRGFFGSQDADETYYHMNAESRSGRQPPYVDRTMYTDWTSRAVSALVLASSVLEDMDLLARAEKVADFIWRSGFDHAKGVCHYFEGPEAAQRLFGQYSDQVYYLSALVDLYQATGEARFLERSRELGELLLERYLGEQGWLCEWGPVCADRDEVSGVLEDLPFDMPELSINSDAARALLNLEVLVPGRGFGGAASKLLATLSIRYMDYSHFASSYALAVDHLLRGTIEIRLSPNGGNGSRRDLVTAGIVAFNPRKMVRRETIDDFPPTDDEAPAPPAVVCSDTRCLPVSSAEELGQALKELATTGAGQASK